MTADMILRLNYQSFYNGSSETIKELLDPINKIELLRSACHLIAVSKNDETSHSTIDKWFSNPEKGALLKVKAPVNTSIINVTSGLRLLSYILAKEDVDSTLVINTDDFEERLFKAFLLLNSEQDQIEEEGQKNLPPQGDDELLSASLLGISYHDYDLQNYDLNEIFIVQLMKSIDFFLFLEGDSLFKEHLAKFLNNYGCDSWQQWIIRILGLLVPALRHNDDNYSEVIVEHNQDFEVNINFLDLFSAPLDYLEVPDFVNIRSRPLVRINDSTFLIINKQFLIERIHKSIVFEFSLKINEEVSLGSRIKNFRSLYCDSFSEQVLLYKTLYNCFPKKGDWKKHTGENFKSAGYSGEPDMYVRFKNKILLFESKDVILKGNEKQSRDFSILSKAFKEKFLKIVKDDKTTNKAIMQIITNIRRVFDKYYKEIDIDYKLESLRIYPILVTHDRQFDSLEFNRLLNLWFKKELAHNFSTDEVVRIQPLTVINIDSLILYQSHFRQRGEYGLEMLIEQYHHHIKLGSVRGIKAFEKMYLDTAISFSDFLRDAYRHNKTKLIPTNLDDYISVLKLKE
ncbi:hypothetical protein GN157_11425 [Flavobacterium rakeshii]|uniref:Uncharacterized protein n=1 Tax=Flavobacterium rakeshii TaxID=1038845 RepID=A0A6N8HF33_9FLAO|nr:hypothetical protein [Flavobacterium rakeshii]MUV04320.1 hypothetical protein [Flavobacterium rakeshii]